MPDVHTDTRVDIETSTGNHDKFAHIVDERKGTVGMAMVAGTPLTALCGKVWVPRDNPRKYPLCPTCKERAVDMGMKVPT